MLGWERTGRHDSRHGAAKTDEHGHETAARQAKATQHLIHDKGHARHVSGVFQNGEEQKEHDDNRQEGQHTAHARIFVKAINKLYRKGEALCVFDGSEVYSLPLNELTGLRVIEEPVSVVGWNKEGSPKQKQFLDSGVILSRDTINGLKFFCALELRHDSEDYALLFPAYELPVVAQLTGLNAPELPPVNLRERRAQGKRELEPVAPPPEDGRIHPMFYWHFPGFQKVAYWCTPGADVSFHSKHPVAYVLLLTLGLIVFCLPWLAFAVGVRYLLPEAWGSGWMWLGVAGGFVAGVGLFNLVGAWLHQYLGHVFTLLCVGGGTLMMAVSLLLLA